MNKTIRRVIGTTLVLSILILASVPVQATDRDCGTCEAYGIYTGNPLDIDGLYNDSSYSGPYIEFWDVYDNLNFTLILNITNLCGIPTDFEWTIRLDAESRNFNLDPNQNPPPPHCFAILGGDNSPVYDEPVADPPPAWQGEPCYETVWVAGLANGNTDVQTLYIEVYNTFYYSFVDIDVTCEAYRNGNSVSNKPSESFDWTGSE